MSNFNSKTKKTKLTLKQAKFTKEYLKSGNGTQAAIKAGYSKNCAQQIATENLSKPVIQQSVASAAEKLGINPEYVLKGFKEIADFNKQTFSRKVKKVVGDGEDASIEEVEEIKMIDAQASLRAHEMLGKHLKLFVDKIEMDAKVEVSNEDEKKNLAKKAALMLLQADLENNE